jgi:hypothetical protein
MKLIDKSNIRGSGNYRVTKQYKLSPARVDFPAQATARLAMRKAWLEKAIDKVNSELTYYLKSSNVNLFL